MSIQKKSLLSSLNTTKKAIVASSSANEETPKVSQPVTGRVYARKVGRTSAMKAGRVALRIASPIEGRKRK